jgi:hypothetical protein
MTIHEASALILKTVHDSVEGSISWADFLRSRTMGYNEQAANEVRGTFTRALFILIDEGLCQKPQNSDSVRLTNKAIEYSGDFETYFKKKKTRVTLEKLRRIAPIISAIIVIISFIITMVTRNAKKNAAQQKPATTAPSKKEPRERR